MTKILIIQVLLPFPQFLDSNWGSRCNVIVVLSMTASATSREQNIFIHSFNCVSSNLFRVGVGDLLLLYTLF